MTDYANAVADLSSMPFPVLLIVKSTLVLAAGACVAFLLRPASASVRYTVWALTLAIVVALPLGMLAAPAWDVAVGSPSVFPEIPVAEPAPISPEQSATSTVASETVVGSSAATLATSARDRVSTVPQIPDSAPFFLWLIGASFVIARMVVGRYSINRLVRKAIELGDESWRSVLDRESARLGVRAPVRLFESARVSTPLAAGFASPVILLPSGAGSWRPEHREVVLRHELAHIAQGDAVVCVLSGIACAIYWFNPLVWIATRKLRAEQERTCDDRVITLGVPPADYAAHLLEVARSARNIGMHSFVSVAMARPSQLEGRLLAVLGTRRRGSLTRSRSVLACLFALIALTALSALRPVRAESAVIVRSQADFPGVVVFAPARRISHVADSTTTGDVAVESGGTLVLDLKTGAGVSITGSNDERVRANVTLGGRDWRNTTVSVTGNDGNARIELDYRRSGGSQSSSHRMTVSVPRRFNVRIRSAGGDLTIRDVDGEFVGTTGGGEIRIERARGHADLSTGGGPVTVRNSTLSGSVSTGGGSVLIQDVEGGLRGSSGTGNVLYGGSSATGSGRGAGIGAGSSGGRGTTSITFSDDDEDGVRRGSDGRLYVRKAGGGVRLDEAPGGASVTTGGGAISIGASRGDVDAYTGGGDVTVGPAMGAVKLSTGAGDVEVTLADRADGPVRVSSGNGTVTITLPSNMSADLELETAFTNNRRNGATRIRSDWPLSPTVTETWDSREGTPRRYVRARTSIGRGGLKIWVKTINGDIVIRRR